ncbi:MAG: XF1762 family protein [Janthinobacterium lividum]
MAWRFGMSIWNGWQMIGVATVGNPVARAFNGRGVVEVNRLCVRRAVPALLRWNAASMLYGQCARSAEGSGWLRIITYTREDEDGTSLRAAGWTKEGPAGGGGWHSAARACANRNAFIRKVRWARLLRPPVKRPTFHKIPVPAAPLCIGDITASPLCSF